MRTGPTLRFGSGFALLLLLAVSGWSQDAKKELEKRRPRATTAETLYDLAMWAYDQGFAAEYTEILTEGIRKEPDHRACRWALGHHRHDGRWLTGEQAKKKGLKLCRGEWVDSGSARSETEAAEKRVAGNSKPSGGSSGNAGSFAREVSVRGKTRRFRLVVPKSYDPSRPLPLLLWLHGDGGRMDSYNDLLLPLVEELGFILVSPESRRWQVWAEGAEGSSYATGRTEDDEYVMECVRIAMREYNVDGRRITCAGQSKGATYSTKLAREQGEFFAAAGLINGVITSAYGRPSVGKAAFFVWFGSGDYLHPQYGIRTHVLELEGHKTELVYRKGAGHGATRESVRRLMEFLLAQSLDNNIR